MTRAPNDGELAERARNGDAGAFSCLVERHYDLVFRVAFRMLGARAEAEDLAQDICVALPAKIAGYRGEAKFTTWLYRLVANAALDRMRSASVRSRAWSAWGDIERQRRAAAIELNEEVAWLNETMASLSPPLRQTVALVVGEELTHAETAEALGISEGTVSWRMSEVKKILRQQARQEERIP